MWNNILNPSPAPHSLQKGKCEGVKRALGVGGLTPLHPWSEASFVNIPLRHPHPSPLG